LGAARDDNFAKADADGDGLHNREESKAYAELMKEFRTERYGGTSADPSQELKD